MASAFGAGLEMSMAGNLEEKMDVKWEKMRTNLMCEDDLDPASISKFPIPMMQVSGRKQRN